VLHHFTLQLVFRGVLPKGSNFHVKRIGGNMKKVTLLIAVLLLAGAAFGQTANLLEVSGKVEINTGSGWQTATTGMVVPVRATISTGFNSTAVFKVGESTLNIRPLTRMTLREYSLSNNEERASLNLSSGRVRATVRSTTSNRVDFRITSPIATASVRGTIFEFDGLNLDVAEGLVDFGSRPEQFVSVPAGGQSQVTDNAPPAMPQEVKEKVAVVVTRTAPTVKPVITTERVNSRPVPVPVILKDTIYGETANLVIRIQ
jgi:hypothetical protein